MKLSTLYPILIFWHSLGYISNIFLKGLGLKLKGAHFYEPLSF